MTRKIVWFLIVRKLCITMDASLVKWRRTTVVNSTRNEWGKICEASRMLLSNCLSCFIIWLKQEKSAFCISCFKIQQTYFLFYFFDRKNSKFTDVCTAESLITSCLLTVFFSSLQKTLFWSRWKYLAFFDFVHFLPTGFNL